MLDQPIKQRICDLTDANLEPRDQSFTQTLRARTNEQAAKGLGGNLIHTFVAEARAELTSRSLFIWQAVQRTYTSMSGEQTNELRVDLNIEVNSWIDLHAKRLAAIAGASLPQPLVTVGNQDMREFIRNEMLKAGAEKVRQVSVEVDFFLDSLRPKPIASPTAITVHGNVNSLQTGPNAVANFVITQGDRDQLAKALDNLKAVVEKSQDGSSDDRRELLGMIGESKEALSSNRHSARILGLLTGIAQTVQTLGSASAAWQAVKICAQSIGFTLPG